MNASHQFQENFPIKILVIHQLYCTAYHVKGHMDAAVVERGTPWTCRQSITAIINIFSQMSQSQPPVFVENKV